MAHSQITNPRAKRTESQRERDLVLFAELYLQGYSLQEISDHVASVRDYTLSRVQVHYDIKLIHERWKEAYIETYDTMKVRELARIDKLERAYWDAWERSMKDKVEEEHEGTSNKMTNAKGRAVQEHKQSKGKKKRTTRDGTARFLEGIQWCIQQRCKILGLNAPTQKRGSTGDWREEAKKAGINDPGAVFNQMVGEYVSAIEAGDRTVDGSDDAGSAEGSAEKS
jgi:hypothetical protein